MCLICTDLLKNKLSVKEAYTNLKELKDDLTEDHYIEVLATIWDKEIDETILEN